MLTDVVAMEKDLESLNTNVVELLILPFFFMIWCMISYSEGERLLQELLIKKMLSTFGHGVLEEQY